MATLKICVQKSRADGTWPVYIRITHKSKHGYIKTDKLVWERASIPKTKEIRKYIHSMQDAGQVRNARNYEMAIKH